ncbi:MAG TPA: hypothetical protein VI336_03025, partial [Candidatus Saccharimonadales bacterium]|nr:hypothetical protein [Candidatus Saccharimonadales bacterium]
GATIEELEARRRDELKSFFIEALKGEISTHYSFELVDGRIVAKDGEPIEELLVRGLRADIKKATDDPFYEFLPYRSRAELDNFRKAQAMANNEVTYNTLLEVSVLNEELDTSEGNRLKLIKAAQKPYWGRTMVRVSHWDGAQLHIITTSSDNLKNAETFDKTNDISSAELFKEAVEKEFLYGLKAQTANQMLAEPLAFNITDGSWKNLAGRLVGRADQILALRQGGQWHQGRPKKEALNLRNHVDSQTEIIEGLLKADNRVAGAYDNYDDYQVAFQRELYNAIALMEMRLATGRTDEIIDYEVAAGNAGAVAEAEGRSYDGCGMVINANSQNHSAANQTGFESLLRLEGKPINCHNCKKKVVVDKKYLEKGELYCKKCGYHVDVCTGKITMKKKEKNLTSQVISGFDILARNFTKIRHETNIRKILKKQASAESELEKKRQAKFLRQEQEELLKIAA